MKLAGFNDECSWLRIFVRFHFWKSRNCRNATKKIFCLSLYFKIRKFIFRQSESCVLTMSSWSRRVKLCGLKSSIEVQQPTVSGNLKKMFYSCLFTSFMSCYCALTEKIYKNGSVVTIDHFSRPRVGSLLVSRSYGDSNVWPGGLLQATVVHRKRWRGTYLYTPDTLPVDCPGPGIRMTVKHTHTNSAIAVKHNRSNMTVDGWQPC